MAVSRIPPKCPICEEPYKALHRARGENFIGDTFYGWDTIRHVCPNSESGLSRYEERLERIVDLIRELPTLEAIGLLRTYIPKLPNESE